MAEKVIENAQVFDIRLSLKYDSLSNWETKNPVLLKGEAAVFIIKTGETNPTQVTPPVVGMKIGDGETEFKLLPMLGGKALDVYSWAKAAVKPTYTADEIEGLATYIAGKVQDTDTQYTFVKVTDYQYKMQSKTIGGAFTDTGIVIDIPNDTEAIGANAEAIAALQELVGDKKIADIYATKEALKEVADDLAEYVEANDEAVAEVAGKVDTLIGDDTGKSARTIANEELAKQLIPENAAEALNELAEIAAWIQAHPGDASAMNLAIQALQNQLKGIAAGDGTVKKYVDDAITALKIGDYALAADLTALADRVKALEDDSHTHGNKDVLDGITADKVEAWDKVTEKANDADLAAIAKTGSTDDLVQGTRTIVFNCGDSSNC